MLMQSLQRIALSCQALLPWDQQGQGGNGCQPWSLPNLRQQLSAWLAARVEYTLAAQWQPGSLQALQQYLCVLK